MKIKITYLSIIFLVTMLSACTTTQKIDALKPEPDDAKPLVYDNQSSIINMPVSIKIKDIENQTNKFLTGQIYDDNNIEDDNYTIKVWKLAPITIANNSGKLQTVLPLKAQIFYRIGTNKLGINLFDTREMNLNGKINLSSEIALNNWKLNTKTELESLDWNESPTMTIAGKNVPITYLMAGAIK
jgi:hypothetical protein